ncbi:MAG: citrate lyase holo-[acyl-carrier protein] synthase [Spirochaetaceae bacterium]|jgi:holo-ACP synthase/triphosphoribosyl-dephospho-CoA synthase|nr:citrate lyase holo-[acyl-carrier protein] synthase [Spirochaetaceae bacterium]
MKSAGGRLPGAFAGCEAVSLEMALALRDRRLLRQRELLALYRAPLLCLSLNIPGPYKRFPLADRCFEEAREALRLTLEAEGIPLRMEEASAEAAGYTAFFVPGKPGETLDLREIKALTVDLEARHPAGRLFDIDLLSPEGEKISRADLGRPERTCFLCGGNAFACARSRAHSLEETQAAAVALIEGFLQGKLEDRIGSAAVKALVGELAVTPKPGLVDRNNCGAHRDMDFFTFINSTAALIPYFRSCAAEGFRSAEGPEGLFAALRRKGKIAERVMGRATGGVNTHRGIIFSLGVLSAAYGRLYRGRERPVPEELMALCREMTAPVLEDFSGGADTESRSHGEELYRRHGITGVRGEAAAGFPSVCGFSYPRFRRMLEGGQCINDAGIAAFFSLLAHVDDTALVHRSDLDFLRKVQGELRDFLAADPPVEALRSKAAELDVRFTSLGVSAGGCADLLAVTWFLHALDGP